MSKKHNSLMRFSRTERLAQLSEQEIVIEKKKREILAKLEAQKKKETEEALRKLVSTRETKSTKPGFSKVSFSGKLGKKNSTQEKSVELGKESLPNAFSNDGSFLDQFKKLSQTGLPQSNLGSQSQAKKETEDSNIKQVSKNFSEKEETNEHRSQKDTTSINDASHLSLAHKSISSKVQLQIPPPGIVQLVSQPAGVKVIASDVNDLNSTAPYLSVQNYLDTAEHSVSEFNSKSSSLSNCPNTTQPVAGAHKLCLAYDSKKQEDSPLQLCTTSLSSVHTPLAVNPQKATPHLFVQAQNSKSHSRPQSELPKNRSETISMTLKPNTIKKLEAIPNPLEPDQSPPSSPNQTQFNSNEERESLKLTFTSASQNFSFTSSLDSVSSNDRNLSKISSAFYDNDEDKTEGGYLLNEKHHQWAELVSRYGDEFEDSLRNCCENEPQLRFLLNKNSNEYLSYRQLVSMYQKRLKSSELEPFEKSRELSLKENFDKNNECSERGNSDRIDIDFKETLASESMTSTDEQKSKSHNDLNFSINKELDSTPVENHPLLNQKHILLKGENSANTSITDNSEETKTEERRKRKRKSRWGEAVSTTSTLGVEPSLQPAGKLPAPKSNLLSQVTRSDPGLIQYARQTFGSTNLSEEDWKKAEDHYKINLLYQDMVKKRAEIEKLEKQGKFKYEYDSDEDTEGGTWEHKLRQQEMQATQLWAEELTRQAAGKHHIGDFLPPEELERFMEKYNAVKEGREPDLSDYKEYKLKQDNVGYRLLQKMGWNEGQGLGQDGSGITNPVNKATTRHENQGLGVERPDGVGPEDDEYDAYRKRMMLAYRFRPNPLNNPRRPYY